MPSAVASCLVQLPSSAFIIRELTEDSFLFFSTLLPPTSTLFPYTTLFRSYAMVCSQSLIRLNSPLESMPFSVKVAPWPSPIELAASKFQAILHAAMGSDLSILGKG